MAFGMFRMMFNAGGNAVPVIEQMNSANSKLLVSSRNAAIGLQGMAQGIIGMSTMAERSETKLLALILRMEHLGRTGQVTSSTLMSVNRQMSMVAQTTPRLAGGITDLQGRLLTMGSGLRDVEKVAAKAGSPQGGFQMMTDVSSQTAQKMRMMSSASQGAMIAMSLLQRNVTGLAFSLIFLQFSGFLKISLAIAGALALVGGITLGFRALVNEGMKMRKLNDQFFILTRSTETSALAMDAARTLADKYGIAIGPLLQAQLESLIGTQKLTNEEFDTLGGLLALTEAGLVKNVDGSEDLIKKFIKLKDEGKGPEEILKELGKTTKEFREELKALDKTELGQMQRRMADLKNSFRAAFEDPSKAVAKWWQDLKASFFLGITGFFEATQSGMANGTKNLMMGMRGLIIAAQEPIARLVVGVFKLMFITPWILIWKDTKKALGDILLGIENIFGGWSGWSKITETFSAFFKDVSTKFGDFVQTIKDSWTEGWRDLEFSWLVFQMKIKRKINDFMSGGWKDALQGLITAAKEVFAQLFDVGKNAAQSLWDGIKSFPLLKMAKEWASNFMSAIRSKFDSSSPSREMMKIGQDAMKGFAIGMGGTQGGGRTNNNININVNVSGSFSNNPRAASQSVATQVLKGITRQGAFSGAPLVA
jgi:hypothetical protein